VSAYDPDLWGVGTVARVAPVVDPSSGTFRVTVDLEPGQGALRPGQFVSVEIEVDRHEGVLVVPREAVVYEDGAPIVYRMIEAPPEDPDSDSDSAGEAPAGRGWGRDRGAPRDADSDSDSEADTEAGPKHVAERVRVQLGLVDAVSAEIVEGLAEGDPVVVIGQSNLRDGAPIRTPGEPAAAVAPGDADAEGPG
jgi:multidrug efflux pump subunit AcrA (membrane-fusion protein)